MTQEEYMARRKEIVMKINDTRSKERKEIEKVEDDIVLAKRNASDRVKLMKEKIDNELKDHIRYLESVSDDIKRKYAAERVELDCQVKLLDAEIKRQFYVSMKEGGEA